MTAAYQLSKKYYPVLWNKERLVVLVRAGKLTEEEYEDITGEEYEDDDDGEHDAE